LRGGVADRREQSGFEAPDAVLDAMQPRVGVALYRIDLVLVARFVDPPAHGLHEAGLAVL